MKHLVISLLMLPTASFAQNFSDASTLLNHFVTRCNQIASNPLAAVEEAFGAGAHIATDESLVTHYESTQAGAELFFRRMVMPGGMRTDCSLVVQGVSGAQYGGLGALVADNGSTLFGGEVITSGNHTDTTAVRMIVTPEFPPRAALTLIQQIDYIELILSQNIPQ